MGMIDLHSHVLPGLDDGAPDVDVSLRMLSIAVADGITTIAGTPHYVPGYYAPSADEVRASASTLREAIARAGLPIELTIAHEVRAGVGLPARLEAGEILAYDVGKRYMLLELPGGRIGHWIDQLIFDLQIADIVPIIAHPERVLTVMKNPEFLYELVVKGCFVQLTAGSLMGRWGEHVRATSEILLRHNLVHVMASDAHDDIDRIPMLSPARATVAQLCGEQTTRALFEENPRRILEGSDFYAPEPLRPVEEEPPGLFGALRRFLD